MEARKKIQSFRDLVVWQQAHELVKSIYLTTRTFPKEETFGLTAQLKKSAISVPSNIVEGFRRTGKKEKLKFYNYAQASLDEATCQLILGIDLGYCADNGILDKCESVAKMLARFVATTKANPGASKA